MLLDGNPAAEPQKLDQVVTPGLSWAAGELVLGPARGIYFANGDAGLIVVQLDVDRLPAPSVGPSPTRRPLHIPTASAAVTPLPTITLWMPTLCPPATRTPGAATKPIYLPGALRP